MMMMMRMMMSICSKTFPAVDGAERKGIGKKFINYNNYNNNHGLQTNISLDKA